MKRSLPFLLAGTVLAGLGLLSGEALAAPSPQNGVCPGIGTLGSATNCNVEIFLDATGGTTTIIPHSNPYDGSDDNLVGIINNSGHTISSLSFSGNDLFGFDGDGLQTYQATAGSDPTGYGGKTSAGQFTTFTAIDGTISGGDCFGSCSSGTVVFGASGIPNGGTAYFSLEGPPSINLVPIVPVTPVPEPASFMLLGMGLVGISVLRRRRSEKL